MVVLKSSVKSFKVSCRQMAQSVLYNLISSPLSRASGIYFRPHIWNHRIVLRCLAHGEALCTVPGGFQHSTKNASMNHQGPKHTCPPQGRPCRNYYLHSYHACGGDGLQHEEKVSVSCTLCYIRRDSGLANAPHVPLWPRNPDTLLSSASSNFKIRVTGHKWGRNLLYLSLKMYLKLTAQNH